MRIGIIGIGTLTLELALRASQKGYAVTVNNPRGNSLVREIFEKERDTIRLSTLEQTAQSDIIILFVPKPDLEEVLAALPDMRGKIVVHTSGLIFDPRSLLSGLSYSMTYKTTATLLPSAHVVKLFKPLKLETVRNATDKIHKDEIFYIADHAPSGKKVKAFLNTVDFEAKDLSGRLKLGYTGLNDGSSFLPS